MRCINSPFFHYSIIQNSELIKEKVVNIKKVIQCLLHVYRLRHYQFLGRLMKTEGVDPGNVEEMRLEFMNIVKMDHLWVLKSLTKLKLNNNLIEKIENLESLIHLQDLDLSFNKITKIENLGSLGKLRILNLFVNKIEKLENMENLKSLTIFSVGKNLIKDKESVCYLI